MIIQARAYRFELRKKSTITHEDFTRRYTLARLEDNLKHAREVLSTMPVNKRRRQREKITRLERQIDRLRLEL